MLKKVVKKHNSARECFVCGVENTHGLKAEFYELEDKTLAALVTVKPHHQSYPGRVHGGVIAALLDETIGRAVNIDEPDAWGVTGEMTTRYKKPVPYDVPLTVTGRITKCNRRLFSGEGSIILPGGEIAATAEATYVKMPLKSISDFDPDSDDWKAYPSANDPEYIDIPE